MKENMVYLLVHSWPYEFENVIGVYTSMDKAREAAYEWMGKQKDAWESYDLSAKASKATSWKSDYFYLDISSRALDCAAETQ